MWQEQVLVEESTVAPSLGDHPSWWGKHGVTHMGGLIPLCSQSGSGENACWYPAGFLLFSAESSAYKVTTHIHGVPTSQLNLSGKMLPGSPEGCFPGGSRPHQVNNDDYAIVP